MLVTFDIDVKTVKSFQTPSISIKPLYVSEITEDRNLQYLYVLVYSTFVSGIFKVNSTNKDSIEFYQGSITQLNTIQAKYGFLYIGGMSSTYEAVLLKTPFSTYNFLSSNFAFTKTSYSITSVTGTTYTINDDVIVPSYFSYTENARFVLSATSYSESETMSYKSDIL